MVKKCQYLPFQDWSVKCKKMVDNGVMILLQFGKQILVTCLGANNVVDFWCIINGKAKSTDWLGVEFVK